jgi:hypothetical protein
MPGGDRTGPRGLGPMTGRRMGYCMGYYPTPRFMRPRFGRGFGSGFGRGFSRGQGFRRRFFRNFDYNPYYDEPITKQEEQEMLKQEATGLEAELRRTKERLKTLESKE